MHVEQEGSRQDQMVATFLTLAAEHSRADGTTRKLLVHCYPVAVWQASAESNHCSIRNTPVMQLSG
jgi:hypothetical protein